MTKLQLIKIDLANAESSALCEAFASFHTIAKNKGVISAPQLLKWAEEFIASYQEVQLLRATLESEFKAHYGLQEERFRYAVNAYDHNSALVETVAIVDEERAAFDLVTELINRGNRRELIILVDRLPLDESVTLTQNRSVSLALDVER